MIVFERLVAIAFIAIVFTQIVVPSLQGKPWFSTFRRSALREAENRLRESQEARVAAKLNEAAEQLDNKTRAGDASSFDEVTVRSERPAARNKNGES